MVIFKKADDIKKYLSVQKKGRRVGFVPTMGALHQGHTSLVRKAKENGDLVVCSIFVNPTQFNDKQDFEKYPISLEDDIEFLINSGCDVLFMPSVEEMYPNGTQNARSFDFGYLDTVLEGAKRPGHFKGVGQVVARLFEIVEPNNVYFGQKDYQQCMVIKKLVGILGLDLEMVICPTVREEDGLAMSSRNRRLTDPQRTLSALLYQCLISIQAKQSTDSFDVVKKECSDILIEKGFEPDYIALANADDLTLLNDYGVGTPMVALIAAKIGDIRLIDNLLLQ